MWNRVEDAEDRARTDRAELYVRAAKAAHLSGEPARAVAFARVAIELVDSAADPARASRRCRVPDHSARSSRSRMSW
jgi:hypothetical protein